jgi:plasmid stabilization system protein ParE
VDFKVLLSEKALSDLSEVVEYITHDNPDAASRFWQSLINHVKVLQKE